MMRCRDTEGLARIPDARCNPIGPLPLMFNHALVGFKSHRPTHHIFGVSHQFVLTIPHVMLLMSCFFMFLLDTVCGLDEYHMSVCIIFIHEYVDCAADGGHCLAEAMQAYIESIMLRK